MGRPVERPGTFFEVVVLSVSRLVTHAPSNRPYNRLSCLIVCKYSASRTRKSRNVQYQAGRLRDVDEHA